MLVDACPCLEVSASVSRGAARIRIRLRTYLLGTEYGLQFVANNRLTAWTDPTPVMVETLFEGKSSWNVSGPTFTVAYSHHE